MKKNSFFSCKNLRFCYTTGMKDKENQIAELSRQYWEALENLDFAWADFCDSALEMMGANPLPKK
tara:strand:+ start:699 stop:893 length:195 start_codon:yes stop_codon:yes gene_type:complete